MRGSVKERYTRSMSREGLLSSGKGSLTVAASPSIGADTSAMGASSPVGAAPPGAICREGRRTQRRRKESVLGRPEKDGGWRLAHGTNRVILPRNHTWTT